MTFTLVILLLIFGVASLDGVRAWACLKTAPKALR